MIIEYKSTISFKNDKPSEVETVNQNVYLRKNIVENQDYVETDIPSEMVHKWEYEECTLTQNEYKEYLSDINRLSTKLLMTELSDISVEQQLNAINIEDITKIIMQAISESEVNVLMTLLEITDK